MGIEHTPLASKIIGKTSTEFGVTHFFLETSLLLSLTKELT